MPPAVVLLLAMLAAHQAAHPLRKSDLIRLLTTPTIAPAEVAEMVRRNCLTFAPSPRDKADLRALGADATLLRRIEECGRRASTPTVEVTVRPAPVVATPSRTGFVSGLGQRGRVGTRLALPLVFEARDIANAPVIGHAVTLSATNARLEGVSGTATDSSGRVRVFVVLGSRAGTVRVTATLGRIEREATLMAVVGPPARLSLRCATETVDGRVTLAPGANAQFEVTAMDALGNAVALHGLRVSVGDESVVRAEPLAGDSTIGRFALRAGKVGATNLVVLGSGLRESLVAAVSKSAGRPTCRGRGSGG